MLNFKTIALIKMTSHVDKNQRGFLMVLSVCIYSVGNFPEKKNIYLFLHLFGSPAACPHPDINDF